MLSKPFLAKCSDRKSMPQNHPASGSPEDWYRNELLEESSLFGISFDFFVNWSDKPVTLTPVIWIKRILNVGNTYEQVIEDLNDVLIKEFGSGYLNRLLDFCTKYNLAVQFIIFRDDYDWKDGASTLLMIDASMDAQTSVQFQSKIISVRDFRKMIQLHSGGPIEIGAKGLTYGTSLLECFLSKTNNLYPGDADLILLNTDNFPVAIIEYKKHTLATPIDLQKLSNYYPHPDRKKYDRLAILRDYLSEQNPELPLIVIYYPTKANFTEGCMELVSGNVGKLNSMAISKFSLPMDNAKEQKIAIIKKSMRAIEYYKNKQ